MPSIRSGLQVLTTLFACSSAVLPAQSIPWAVSLDGALTEARERGTVVVVAIHMPGERGSDVMRESHYRDAKITALAKETVNLLIEVGPGRVPADERKVRERYLKVEPDALVAVPHHLWIKPGAAGEPGELLSSVAYQMTPGQLEWAWADAIQKVRPDFEWKPDDRARAPESLLYGEAEKEGTEPPPTRDEVREAIQKLRMGWAEPKSMFENYRTVLSSSEKEALQYGRTEMRNLSAFLKRPAMRLVADVSPPEWHELATEYLDDNDPRVREEAARALERLAVDRSTRVLRSMEPKEEDEATRGRMIRAMAACGPADKNVVRQLEKILRKDKAEAVRVQAAMAIQVLEDRDAVTKLLGVALQDEAAHVRTAATYVIAARRDADLAQMLKDAQADEGDAEVSGWMATAGEVLEGGDLRKFRTFLEKVVQDRKPGDGGRQFSLKLEDWMERMRGGRGGQDGAKGEQPEGGGGQEGKGEAGGRGGAGTGRRRGGV
jgi:hypothetical protein